MDMNTRHPMGWTALHVASINSRLGVVKALLKAGADPDLGDDFINIQRTAIEKGLHSMNGLYLGYKCYNFNLVMDKYCLR